MLAQGRFVTRRHRPALALPLLDELLAPHREAARRSVQSTTQRATEQQPPAPVGRQKMISQIPPTRPDAVIIATRAEPILRASDLARYKNLLGGAKETRTPDPLLANRRIFHIADLRLRPFLTGRCVLLLTVVTGTLMACRSCRIVACRRRATSENGWGRGGPSLPP